MHAPVRDTNPANVASPQSTSVWNLPAGLLVSIVESTIADTDTKTALSSCVIAAAFRVYYLRAATYTGSPPYTKSQRKPYQGKKLAVADARRLVDKISTACFLVTIWFLIEAQTSIIAACLPTLAPLFHSNNHVSFKHRALPLISSLEKMRPQIMELSTKDNSTLSKSGSNSDSRLSEHLRSNPSHDESISGARNADLEETDIV